MVRQQRYEAACRLAARLMEQGYVVYSPIAHSHGLAVFGGLRGDWEFWERCDRAMLEHASLVVVLRLDGWAESSGVMAEIGIAWEMGIPVEYLEAAT